MRDLVRSKFANSIPERSFYTVPDTGDKYKGNFDFPYESARKVKNPALFSQTEVDAAIAEFLLNNSNQ